jgi:hypothetical protein
VRPVTRRRRWSDPLVAVLLIFVLSGCWSAALAASLPDNSSDPLSSTPDEENEKQENGKQENEKQENEREREREREREIAPTRVRPPEPPQAAVATAPKQKPVTHRASTLLASVAPKSHPSRFSVRRLQ